jgi:hypothetical protein
LQPFYIPSNFYSNQKLYSIGFYARYNVSISGQNNFGRLIISSQSPANFSNYDDFAPYILADEDFTMSDSFQYVQIDLSQYNIILQSDTTLYFWFISTYPNGNVFYELLGRSPVDYNSSTSLAYTGYYSTNDIYPSPYKPCDYSGYKPYNCSTGQPWYTDGTDMVKLDLYYTPSIPQPYVNIIKPQNNEVITNQTTTTPPYSFDFWGVNYFLPDAATGTTATFYLNYSNLDETINHEEQFYLPIDDYTISTSTQFYFGKTYYLPNGDYKARAIFQYQLAGTTTQAIIYSDEVYFTINEAGGISYGTSTTSTIPIPNFEDICTSPPGGFLDYPTQNITYALCKVFSYLFIPNQEQQQNIQNRFSSFQDIIKSKPPLGYFYKIKDALNQNITIGNATTTQVLNTSTTQAFSAVFSPLKTGLNWVLWLAAGSWVFIKIKNLNI